jgi:lysine N6-hydroxylase
LKEPGEPAPGMYDVVGVGVGPSNLSLAALADRVPDLCAAFFERRPEFSWHPGLLLPSSKLQVSFLKDLVTPVDPTSPYSFLNFLAKHGRLYRFLIAQRSGVSRGEFQQYFRWVAESLPSISFSSRVEAVDFSAGRFHVQMTSGTCDAKNVVLGNGMSPYIPPSLTVHLGSDVFHSSQFLAHAEYCQARRVLVVGGGQSAAEIVHYLLGGACAPPREITWATRRHGFLPLDDSPFTNEWFNPNYVGYFRMLAPERRRWLVFNQKLASNGVDESLLQMLFARLYELDYLEGRPVDYRLLPSHILESLCRKGAGFSARLRSQDTGNVLLIDTDVVVACTGYEHRTPDFLGDLAGRLHKDSHGLPLLRGDYSVEWDGPHDRRIYMQNAGLYSHGIADPNLSLIPWRSAEVINSLCNRNVYGTDRDDATITPSSEMHRTESVVLRRTLYVRGSAPGILGGGVSHVPPRERER